MEPKHNKGHTLDLVISKSLNVSKIAVADVLSDNSSLWEAMSVQINAQAQVIT